MDPVRLTRKLARQVDELHFAPPVTHVYNPLVYARAGVEQYLKQYAHPGCEAFLVGMNPGPWGMAQTGVPFGEVSFVRDWLGIHERVEKPINEHPKRPIQGLDCQRSEVSGQRLWGWAQSRFKTPKRFFKKFFVWNYCPLVFMEESGRNRTPDKLPAEEREPLFELCDDGLRQMIEYVKPKRLIGIGAFATKRLEQAMRVGAPPIGTVLHPSPASPLANRGWAEQAEAQLRKLGIQI
jgi:single-strand selective monofunctional uracil DNA glycosylase